MTQHPPSFVLSPLHHSLPTYTHSIWRPRLPASLVLRYLLGRRWHLSARCCAKAQAYAGSGGNFPPMRRLSGLRPSMFVFFFLFIVFRLVVLETEPTVSVCPHNLTIPTSSHHNRQTRRSFHRSTQIHRTMMVCLRRPPAPSVHSHQPTFTDLVYLHMDLNPIVSLRRFREWL
jgi:hypothetical protein